ncbi:MAG: hypothetical protein IJ416_01360 [Ruminiclostridium sp.]|nr:hypothetical protein [Ruminiclostridium sp.]
MNTDFIKELNIEMLIKIKESTFDGRGYLNLERYFTTDIDTINYRLDALSDLLSDRTFFYAMQEIMPQISMLQELRQFSAMARDDIENLYSVRDLNTYIELVEYLYTNLNKYKLNSAMFSEIKKAVNEIHSSDEYEGIKAKLPENMQLITELKSITIGVNIDAAMRPIESGIVSLNNEVFVSGNVMDKLFRLDMSDNPYECAAPLSVPPKILTKEEKQLFEATVNTAVHKLLKSSLKSWKPAVKAYSESKINFLMRYYENLRFLVAAAEFFYTLKDMNYPVCRPKVYSKEEKKCVLKEIYYPEFVLYNNHMKGNDFSFDENGMIYIFGGANGGGKTLFARSVAICQALFQLGLYVPAQYAELSPCDEILLHFQKKNNDVSQSRFMEECERISTLMKFAGEYTLVICDEALSGTNGTEAVPIAEEVLKAMSAKGCRGIFITHVHEIGDCADTINELDFCKSKIDHLTVLTDQRTGNRLYKVVRNHSDGKSDASFIAKKYGLDFYTLMKGEKND